MMAASVLSGHETLKCASVVFLTLGTTRVFRHLASDRIVANCHKQPAKEFESRCLGFDETVAVLAECIELIRGFNPRQESFLQLVLCAISNQALMEIN